MVGRIPWGVVAAVWCALFALLHLFWALGGSWLLSSSAGTELARDRPLWFVIGGLWGVAVLLVLGAVYDVALARRRFRGRIARPAALLSVLVGAGLLLRGFAVQVILLTDVGGVASSVGPAQTHLSLLVWNPWFVVGGAFFVAAGIQRWRPRPSRTRRS
jgi:Protein of unknown function (DUF3995)